MEVGHDHVRLTHRRFPLFRGFLDSGVGAAQSGQHGTLPPRRFVRVERNNLFVDLATLFWKDAVQKTVRTQDEGYGQIRHFGTQRGGICNDPSRPLQYAVSRS